MDEDNAPAVIEQDFTKAPVQIEHEWIQRGHDLVCESCPHPHSSIGAVPFGMMLVQKDGAYDIVPLT